MNNLIINNMEIIGGFALIVVGLVLGCILTKGNDEYIDHE